MREIIISKTVDEPSTSETVYLLCNEFKDLQRFIDVAMRMRPDRITIEYHEFLA